MKKKKELNYSYINKYITDNFIISDDINVIIKNFILLEDMFRKYNYIPTDRCLLKLISKNTKYLRSLEFIFNRYRDQIILGNSNQIFNSNVIVVSIDCYCLLNKIEINYMENFDFSDAVLNDDLKYYLLEINQIPLLKAKEEKDLCNLISQKKQKIKCNKEFLEYAINNNYSETAEILRVNLIPELERELEELVSKLIEHNLRLVVYVAAKFRNKGLDFVDLIQDGNYGLIKAANMFNPKMGYKFSTYATVSIKNTIIRAVQDTARTIRIPNHMHPKISNYKNVVARLTEELGHDPSTREVAEVLGISDSDVDLLSLSSMEIGSLNAFVNPLESDEIGDYIAAPMEDDSDRVYISNSFDYDKLFSPLSDRERKILELRVGIYGRELTLEEVGKIFGIERERVRQIQNRALNKLKMAKSTDEFVDCMPNPESARNNIIKYRKENSVKNTKTYHKNIDNKSQISDNDLIKMLSKLLDLGKINSLECVIISLLIGLCNDKNMTIKDIADFVKKSESEVQLIINNIKNKLRSANGEIYSLLNYNYTRIKKI